MDDHRTADRLVDLSKPVTASAPPIPFDPAGFLDGRHQTPVPHLGGPAVAIVREFDPATLLGARALRGAFNLATVKPLVSTIGGVEMVTVPASAYAYALRLVNAQEQLAEALSGVQIVEASGLDDLAVGDRIAGNDAMPGGDTLMDAEPLRFVPSPDEARIEVPNEAAERNVSEAHGAALDDGRSTEAHSAGIDGGRPEKPSRGPKAVREVP